MKSDVKSDVKRDVKGDVKRAAASDSKPSAMAAGWPVDDINGLARRLPEVDPASYFDRQARDAYQQSLMKWPVLARLMNLVARDEVPAATGENEPVKELAVK
jgi:hypothetical protein